MALRSERQAAAYEQVAHEVEKLVTLFYESQQNQQAFMTEAYRLLQAQSREVEEIRDRAYTMEQIMQVLQDILKKLAALADIVKINVNVPDEQQPVPSTEPVPSPYPKPTPGPLPQPKPSPTPGIMGGQPAYASEVAPPYPVPAAEPPIGMAGDMMGMPEGMQTPAEEPEAVPALKPIATGYAEVRFLHASPDAPGVDIYVDGKKAVSNITYENVTHYARVEAGRHRIQVFPAGKTAGAVIDTAANLKPDAHYTVAAAGRLKEIRPVVVEDHRGGTKPGFARLKVVHLSPMGPAVDVTLPTGKVLLGHLTYKEKSPYLQVAPGVRDLDVRLAGKQQVILRAEKLRFEPNTTYTLYVLGHAGERMVPLLLQEG